MKKICTLIASAMFSLGVYAQGTVPIYDLSYTISTNATSVGGGVGAISTVANSYYFALLTVSGVGATSTNTVDGSWLFTGLTATNRTAAAGTIIGAGGLSGAATLASSGWAAGVTNSFIIVGWSANLGSTWASISNQLATGVWSASGFFGISSIGYAAAGGATETGTAPNPVLFGTLAGQIGAFTLYAVPVPEPSTIALAGLGAASLLLFRRRK